MNQTDMYMQNVMAAFNTLGVAYTPNQYPSRIKKTLGEIFERGTLIEFSDPNFGEKFEEAASIPHYTSFGGHCWAEGCDYVIIQFSSFYQMEGKDWEDYACMCGCNDMIEAQALYGNPEIPHRYVNVRVKKDSLYYFVQSYAKLCWQ